MSNLKNQITAIVVGFIVTGGIFCAIGIVVLIGYLLDKWLGTTNALIAGGAIIFVIVWMGLYAASLNTFKTKEKK